MIHDDVKAAREAAGLSVSEVAKRAEVPRQQVYALERGGNVTLDTLRRIASVIPNLERVTLGGMNILTANEDLDEARRAAVDLLDVAKRLIAALGARGTRTAVVARQPASQSVRHGERQTAEPLEQRARQGKRKRRSNA